MTLKELVSTHLFNKGTNVLADGVTVEAVRDAFSGLDEALGGLTESELNKLMSDTKPLESYIDKRFSSKIKEKETEWNRKLESEKGEFTKREAEYKKSIESLKASVPMPEDPAELRKRALDEPDPDKRERMQLKADNIEIKRQLEERAAIEAKQLEELKREKLVNVARKELGDRKLPKSLLDRIDAFIGSDEETTIGKTKAFAEDWDNFVKDIKTSGLNTQTPGGPGEPEVPDEEKMKQRLDSMSWLDK